MQLNTEPLKTALRDYFEYCPATYRDAVKKARAIRKEKRALVDALRASQAYSKAQAEEEIERLADQIKKEVS